MSKKSHWTSISKSILAAMVITPLLTNGLTQSANADDTTTSNSNNTSAQQSGPAIIRYFYNNTLISNVTVGNGPVNNNVSDYTASIPTGYQIVGSAPTVKYGNTTDVNIEPTNNSNQSTNVATILYQYKGQTIRQATISGGTIGESVGDYSYENPSGYTINGSLPTATYGQTTIVPVTKNTVNTKITFYYNGKELSDTTYTTKPDATIDFSSIVPTGYQSSTTSFTTGDYDTNYNVNLSKTSDTKSTTTTINYKYDNQTVGQYQQTSTNGDNVDYQNNLPDGYKLTDNQNQKITNSDNDQTVDVNVEPINASTTVNFISNGTTVGSQTYTSTYGKTIDFKNDIPTGYQLSNSKTLTTFKNNGSNKTLNIDVTNLNTTSSSTTSSSASANSSSTSSATATNSSNNSSNSSNTSSTTSSSNNSSSTSNTKSMTSDNSSSQNSSTNNKSEAATTNSSEAKSKAAKSETESKAAKSSSEAKSKAAKSSSEAKSEAAKSETESKATKSSSEAKSRAAKSSNAAESKANKRNSETKSNTNTNSNKNTSDNSSTASYASSSNNATTATTSNNSANNDNINQNNTSNTNNLSSNSNNRQKNQTSHKNQQKLPQTGEASTNWLTAIGIMIVSLSSAILIKIRNPKKH